MCNPNYRSVQLLLSKEYKVIGHNFIGGSRSAQGTTLLKSIHATTGEALPYEFHHATEQ
ncbi:hypothetical protein ACT4TH_000001, partial [Acinetobacter baumannii]